MTSRRRFLAGTAAALLMAPARAQKLLGVVHEVAGDVTVNHVRLTHLGVLEAGQTLRTGADGRIWFSLGGDACFLRPNSELRLDAWRARDAVIDLLRLVSGALGATFARGMHRTLIAPTATIGIRGTGIYLAAAPDAAYLCTCFGATEIATVPSGGTDSVAVAAEYHQARRIAGGKIVPAPFESHTNEEIARLEALVGRPDPFARPPTSRSYRNVRETTRAGPAIPSDTPLREIAAPPGDRRRR
jgi:hypothetical protein